MNVSLCWITQAQERWFSPFAARLFGVWQWVYQITQQYIEELENFKGYDGFEEEQQQLCLIMSQIQTALQATGERLEDGPTLLSYPGLKQMECNVLIIWNGTLNKTLNFPFHSAPCR